MTGRAGRRLAAGVALVVAIAGPGCSDDDDDATGDAERGVAELSVRTGGDSEYRFDMAGRVEAGAVRLDLSNAGEEAHHAQVFRLADGASVADLTAALATGEPAAALEVGTFLGGTALVSPGTESQADAVVDLEAGNHVLLCFVPDPDGTPHVAHGMVEPFEVTATGDAAPPPDAAVEIQLADYRFDIPDTVDGDETLSVTNAASTEAHEMVITRAEDGVAVDDVVGALDARQPLPAVGVGGMQALLPGATQHLALDLAPGRYVLYCAVTSPDGTRHYRAGMAREVTVT